VDYVSLFISDNFSVKHFLKYCIEKNKFRGFVVSLPVQKGEGERERVTVLSLPITMILMGWIVFVPLLKAGVI
jgi:hypothetical protein